MFLNKIYFINFKHCFESPSFKPNSRNHVAQDSWHGQERLIMMDKSLLEVQTSEILNIILQSSCLQANTHTLSLTHHVIVPNTHEHQIKHFLKWHKWWRRRPALNAEEVYNEACVCATCAYHCCSAFDCMFNVSSLTKGVTTWRLIRPDQFLASTPSVYKAFNVINNKWHQEALKCFILLSLTELRMDQKCA